MKWFEGFQNLRRLLEEWGNWVVYQISPLEILSYFLNDETNLTYDQIEVDAKKFLKLSINGSSLRS